MTNSLKRIVFILLALWVPLQGVAGVLVAPGCGDGHPAAAGDHGWHAVHAAHHGQSHSPSSPGADSGDDSTYGCGGCSFCQDCFAPALPVAQLISPVPSGHDDPTATVSAPAPLFPDLPDRPPLA